MCCYHKNCTLLAHVTCLAPRLSGCGKAETIPHVIPVSGACPSCGQELLWGELVRRYKAAAGRTKEDSAGIAPANKRKVSLTGLMHTTNQPSLLCHG